MKDKCPDCKGLGFVKKFNYWKYYHSPMKRVLKTCKRCDGMGRIK